MFFGMWQFLFNKRGRLQGHLDQNNSVQPSYRRNERIKLPNFIVVGAPKAGTSSIGTYLDAHPSIYISPIKEPHFFSDDIRLSNFRLDYKKSVSFDVKKYLNRDKLLKKHIAFIDDHSQYLGLFRDVRYESAIGELSTGYMYSNCAAENIFKFNPSAKILMVLRNPSERAYSHYLMDVQLGFEDRDFLSAVQHDFVSEASWGVSNLYIELGLYAKQIKRYLKHFPRNQIKIILFDDFVRSPQLIMQDIYEFLGVANKAITDNFYRVNYARVPRFIISAGLFNKLRMGLDLIPEFINMPLKCLGKKIIYSNAPAPKLNEHDFNVIISYFKEDILELSSLIERDLSSWLEF